MRDAAPSARHAGPGPRPATRRPLLLTTTLLLAACSAATAAPSAGVAYVKGGEVWVTAGPAPSARRVPGTRGTVLLAASPVGGTLAVLTGPAGADVNADRAPLLTARLSRRPYTSTALLSTVVPDAALSRLPARWLTWSDDGRTVLAGTDAGTRGWNVATRRALGVSATLWPPSTSLDGDVTAGIGSVASPDEPGVLLYGPGARPGTEVFSRSAPGNLMAALRREPALRTFTEGLDPRAQAQDASWVVTPPRVTRDGQRVYFATNAGWGVGSGGSTTSAVFQVGVRDVALRALGWLGTFSGSALELLPSPDGTALLLLHTRHTSNAEVSTAVSVADVAARTRRPLTALAAPAGRVTVLAGTCWLADGRHVALSAAQVNPATLSAATAFVPPVSAFTLLVVEARTGRVVQRVPGATQPACLPA
ncbi:MULTISPECIES: hypothetical protein [Deinococcus]|uniref:Uncharacterized protein n=1 Tax=Deinococcus rufus TaxID=2136097 RepID=A0ABV7Z316_9DEIO|nr:hypothetical protein [Deinococcus sp. AB2017081]WQE95867.1 hypothetical protein U2P90_02995 [Deinococcus sp. AB2017081]